MKDRVYFLELLLGGEFESDDFGIRAGVVEGICEWVEDDGLDGGEVEFKALLESSEFCFKNIELSWL